MDAVHAVPSVFRVVFDGKRQKNGRSPAKVASHVTYKKDEEKEGKRERMQRAAEDTVPHAEARIFLYFPRKTLFLFTKGGGIACFVI
jgi:hypothetical protein